MLNKLAQNPFGSIRVPDGISTYSGGDAGGLAILINIVIKTMIVGAGIYTVFNFILAGYAYLSGAGDPKQIQFATAKIWQSIIGIIVAAGSVMLAGLIGRIFLGDSNAILNLQIFTP